MEAYAELKALRLELHFSIGEMAAVMGVPKSTYQGYETGRRAIPPGFINRCREYQQQDLQFMAGIGARIDAALAAEGYGAGIPSAITREEF